MQGLKGTLMVILSHDMKMRSGEDCPKAMYLGIESWDLTSENLEVLSLMSLSAQKLPHYSRQVIVWFPFGCIWQQRAHHLKI